MEPDRPTRTRQAFQVVESGALSLADGRSFNVGADPLTIGRSVAASIAVEDPEVSALHCELVATSSGVILRDTGSTNGTFVGNIAVREARLVGECVIRVGQTKLSFRPAANRLVQASTEARFGDIVGSSLPMRRLYDVLRGVAPTDLSVLISGETGTGKEVFAKAIHSASERRDGPFVVIDCAAITATLAESFLFGHEKGAFTGATSRHIGAFRQANGGTVFLDELGELPDELQPRLLRAIAERTVRPVGSTSYVSVDVRVIAATRRDLRREINAGRFRSDLFFRLAQVRIEIPPLRDRTQDIADLVLSNCERMGCPAAAAATTQYIDSRFRNYDWPGNVRELMNIASVLASLDDRRGADLLDYVLPMEGQAVADPDDDGMRFAEAKMRFEREYFRRLQAGSGGNISEISRRCGLARHHVREHLRKLGLLPQDDKNHE